MKKILIIEDNPDFLEAAKKATINFPNISFSLIDSPSKALTKIDWYDGIITDLFFPEETDQNLGKFYKLYVKLIKCCMENFQNDNDIRKAKIYLKRDSYDIYEQLSGIKNQLPYGGILMLYADILSKSKVLITDMHRHCNMSNSVDSKADGMLILLPLIAKYVLSYDEIMSDGKNSLFLIGCDVLYNIEQWTKPNAEANLSFQAKSLPEAWELAIEKCLIQRFEIKTEGPMDKKIIENYFKV